MRTQACEGIDRCLQQEAELGGTPGAFVCDVVGVQKVRGVDADLQLLPDSHVYHHTLMPRRRMVSLRGSELCSGRY